MIGTSAELFPQTPEDVGMDDFNIHEISENADGSSIYEISNNIIPFEEEGLESDRIFDANLALEMDQSKLNGIASTLLEDIRIDLESRSEWEKTITLVMKYLGWQVSEFRTVPFLYASAAFDSTLSEALLTTYAVCVAELLPPLGPVNCHINGIPTPQTEDSCERRKMFMNYYLTKEDKEYYPDSRQSILYTIFFGSNFKKCYVDPISEKPIARMIKSQDFIVNMECTTLLSSTRITQAIYLTKSDILKREKRGYFVPGTLMENDGSDEEESPVAKQVRKIEGIDTSSKNKKSIFKYYECHTEWDPNDIEQGMFKPGDKDDIPRPYIITIAEDSKKIAAIRRGWKPDSHDYKKRHYFIHHKYLDGFGLYGVGIAHLAGSNAIALTSITRQLIDKGTLCNFPGGLKQTGLKVENNDINIGPTEFKEVDTAGQPIQDCVMLMPYSEPSTVLANMIENLSKKTEKHLGIPNTEIPDHTMNVGSGAAITFMENVNRLQTTVLRSLHNSYSLEFEYLSDLFAEVLPDTPYPFNVPGKDMVIMKQDFNDKISVSPISDPNVLTSAQRLMNAEAELKYALSAPEYHDVKEAFRRVYQAMKVNEIDKLLKPEEPAMSLDPITENMLMLAGKKVVATIQQDQHSHLINHEQFAEEQKAIGNLQAYIFAKSHMQEHKFYEVVTQIPELAQNPMVAQVPIQQIMQDVQIQNVIAKNDAELVMQQIQRQQEQAAKHEPVSPTEALMADIEQHREASYLKNEESKLKAETESYKAMLKHEAEMAKVMANQEMAENKNEVDLFLAELKTSHPKSERKHEHQ